MTLMGKMTKVQCLNDTYSLNNQQLLLEKIDFLLFLQATFFIAYVVTSGWTSTSSELFRLTTLIFNFIKRNICRKFDDEFEVPSVPYHSEIPRILLFGLLGITYFFLAPLILPFLLVYYCLGYLIYRNQVGCFLLILWVHNDEFYILGTRKY